MAERETVRWVKATFLVMAAISVGTLAGEIMKGANHPEIGKFLDFAGIYTAGWIGARYSVVRSNAR